MHLRLTRMISKPHPYVKMLRDDFNDVALTEEQGALNRGSWSSIYGNANPIDLEIGTGSGHFFSHYAGQNPDRNLLGVEVKFKPLIQAVRKCQGLATSNYRIVRFRAEFLHLLVSPKEVSNVFIHFPDPWPKRSQKKNRLLNQDFFRLLFSLQTPGCDLQIKTDSADYFDFILKSIGGSGYKALVLSRDFHREKHDNGPAGEALLARDAPLTQFEKIFVGQNLPVHFGLWRR